MIYTENIQKAVHYSIAVHELDRPERQRRKGKDVAYITHPLTVGLILAQAGAREEVVIAGILHDTIEDSDAGYKVTREMLEREFGAEVATLVDSVSEQDRDLSWHERKEAALEEMRHFPHDSLLLKSGDVISNTTELLRDYEREGEQTFQRFNAPKAQLIEHTELVIQTILDVWPENPLASDLLNCHAGLEAMRSEGRDGWG
jgi:(p)ppGpp synthase/HD superfamily hydrolase